MSANWAIIEHKWHAYGPALQDRWGRLTEDDVKQARAGRDELLTCVLRRYRMDRNMAERQVDDWVNSAS